MPLRSLRLAGHYRKSPRAISEWRSAEPHIQWKLLLSVCPHHRREVGWSRPWNNSDLSPVSATASASVPTSASASTSGAYLANTSTRASISSSSESIAPEPKQS
jgi:hypothetical protein